MSEERIAFVPEFLPHGTSLYQGYSPVLTQPHIGYSDAPIPEQISYIAFVSGIFPATF
jgi:hypothetical protein